MVAVRDEVLVFAVKLQLIVPVSVPLAPDVIDNQSLPDIIEVDQRMVPVPVLETLNVVVPASIATAWLTGEITKLPNDPGCPPRTART